MDLNDLKNINADCHITTLAGEEVLNTSTDSTKIKQLNQLVGSFVDQDRLCHSLKLGGLKKIMVINESDTTGEILSASMQSKVANNDGPALLTTAIANTTEEAYIATGILKGIAEKVLT